MEHDDLRIEIYEDSSSEVILAITHIPTGIVVSGKESRRFVLKNELLNSLRNLIGENIKSI